MNQLLKSLYDTAIVRNHRLLSKVTKPLCDHFDVSYFSYQKIYADGIYHLLSNRPEYIEQYIANHVYKHDIFVHSPKNCKYGKNIYLLDNNANKINNDLSYIYKNCRPTFKINQQFIITLKGIDHYKVFCFGTTRKDNEIIATYRNELSLLLQYITYFQKQVSTILHELDDMKTNIAEIKGEKFIQEAPSYAQLDLDSRLEFLKHIEPEEYRFIQNFRKLTHREKECLYWMALGKTAIETGAILNISNRTVEYYRDSCRNKLGIHYSFNNILYLTGKLNLFS